MTSQGQGLKVDCTELGLKFKLSLKTQPSVANSIGMIRKSTTNLTKVHQPYQCLVLETAYGVQQKLFKGSFSPFLIIILFGHKLLSGFQTMSLSSFVHDFL